MYNWYALLNHLPKVLIRWSGIPAVAADVAAPIRKLCPEKFPSIPARDTAFRSHAVSVVLVSGDPFLWRNKGPALPPRK